MDILPAWLIEELKKIEDEHHGHFNERPRVEIPIYPEYERLKVPHKEVIPLDDEIYKS